MSAQTRLTFGVLLLVPTFLFINLQTFTAQTQWQQTGGPFTGRIFTIAQNQNQTLFAGTEKGGVFRSTNNGASWEYSDLAGVTIRKFYIHQDGRIFVGLQNGLYLSTDNGVTWKGTSLPASQNGFGIVVNQSGDIFVGGWSGIHRSTDAGNTWIESSTGLISKRVNELAIDKSGNLYAGLFQGGLYKSTNNGTQWSFVDQKLQGVSINSIQILSNGFMFIGTSENGVYRSSDDGKTWMQVVAGMDKQDVEVINFTSNGNLFAGTYSGALYRSSDSGDTWTLAFTTAHAVPVLSMTEAASGNLFIGTYWEGVYSSTDNGNIWKKSSTGLMNYMTQSLAIDSQGAILMTHEGANGIFVSRDQGMSWTEATGGQNIFIRALAKMSSDIFYAATSAGVWHTTNNGTSWIPDTNGIANKDIRTIAINDQGYIFASAYGGDLFRSTNSGAEWTLISSGGSDVVSLAFTTLGYVHVGTTNNGLYRSSDNGNTWKSMLMNLPYTNILSLAYHSQIGLYAGGFGQIHYSTDNGQNWFNTSYDIPNSLINTILITPDQRLVVGTYGKGVFYFEKSITKWIPFNDGLINKNIKALALHQNGNLFAGTDGNGVFKIQSVPTDVEKIISPSSVILYQNYPNPFTSSTAIGYRLLASGFVRLEVFDMLGRKVATLVDEEMEAGEYTSTFDIQNSPGDASWKFDIRPGVYFYCLRVGKNVLTRKMVVMR